MRVAFATCDGERVDAELRGAPRLDVYEVTRELSRLERSHTFEEAALGGGVRIRALAGTDLLFVTAIGPSEVVRLALGGIRVAAELTRPRITSVIFQLQHKLNVLGKDRLGPITVI